MTVNTAKPAKRGSGWFRRDWRLYLMLVPTLLVFLLWRYMPMYELLGSFKVTDVVKPVADQYFMGFSNFKALLLWNGTFATMSGNCFPTRSYSCATFSGVIVLEK